MKILKWIGIVLVALVLVGFFLPDEVVIERSKVVKGTPEALQAQAASLKSWPEWSFWSKEEDPTATFSFAGAENGPGQVWKWKGEKFTEGQMELVESVPGQNVKYKITMADGMAITGQLQFAKEGDGTKITWTDRSKIGMGPLGGWLKLAIGGMIDTEQGKAQEKSMAGLEKKVAGA